MCILQNPHPHRNMGWPRMSLISASFVWWEGALILKQWFGERYREGHLGKTIQRLQRGHASLSHPPGHPEGSLCLLHHCLLVLMTLSILFVHQVGNQGELLPWGEWAIGKHIWMTKQNFSDRELGVGKEAAEGVSSNSDQETTEKNFHSYLI